MARGQLTEEVKAKSMELLGYEITRTELRLMPYIMDRIMNHAMIKGECVNQEDMDIIRAWKEKGYIDCANRCDIRTGMLKIRISGEFYKIMSEILFVGYAQDMLIENQLAEVN